MAFTSLSCCSTPFMGTKSAFNQPNSIPKRVHFRQLRVSATACAPTAERPMPPSHIVPQASLYEVLGIQTGATCQEIKAAYRRLARVLHPDVAGNDRGDDTASEFIRVHEAYATLSDPEKRADYDRTLMFMRGLSVGSSRVMSASAPSMTSSVASRFSGYARRTWETDQCW
ncbi:hypothetical protein SLEP1_g28297 [Rubroshorea leprosula]|uniref:J domain-containing protein n=1 Tax=Rubroshorea leprosula TaxID=152421 RepID=A0AAV5JYT8_9ROSI|nr:hypothetical protein SLEP1_g28297 [Rubroshorea leprosula]